MPPGRATKAALPSAIIALRSCMVCTMCSSSHRRLACSLSTSACGITPTTRAPASRAASATTPIEPPRPPPHTSWPPWAPIQPPPPPRAPAPRAPPPPTPIDPPPPPPYPSWPPWAPIQRPTACAASAKAGFSPGREPQYTQTEKAGSAMEKPLPGRRRPKAHGQQQRQQHRRTAQVFGALGQHMRLWPDAVDGALDAGVEQFHDQHQHDRARQQGHLAPVAAEPERQRQHDDGSDGLLAKGPLVPAGPQAVDRIARSMPDAAQAPAGLLRVVRRIVLPLGRGRREGRWVGH